MKKVIKINESTIKRVVMESLKRRLFENNDYDDIYDGEGDDEDDWRSGEPDENEVQSVLSDMENRCKGFGLTFRDLGDHEFGVICKVGNDGIPSGNVSEFLKYAEMKKADGSLMQIGGGVSNNGIWHRKYRILKVKK